VSKSWDEIELSEGGVEMGKEEGMCGGDSPCNLIASARLQVQLLVNFQAPPSVTHAPSSNRREAQPSCFAQAPPKGAEREYHMSIPSVHGSDAHNHGSGQRSHLALTVSDDATYAQLALWLLPSIMAGRLVVRIWS
jgi:hypothetical protein